MRKVLHISIFKIKEKFHNAVRSMSWVERDWFILSGGIDSSSIFNDITR